MLYKPPKTKSTDKLGKAIGAVNLGVASTSICTPSTVEDQGIVGFTPISNALNTVVQPLLERGFYAK